MTKTKHTLEDIITEWRNFESEHNPLALIARTKELKSLEPEIGEYIKKYNTEVYQPIISLYFKNAASIFKQYREENDKK